MWSYRLIRNFVYCQIDITEAIGGKVKHKHVRSFFAVNLSKKWHYGICVGDKY